MDHYMGGVYTDDGRLGEVWSFAFFCKLHGNEISERLPQENAGKSFSPNTSSIKNSRSPRKEERFAVVQDGRMVSMLWKVLVHGSDIYVFNDIFNKLRIKISLHDSGICKISFYNKFIANMIDQDGNSEKSDITYFHRFARKKNDEDSVISCPLKIVFWPSVVSESSPLVRKKIIALPNPNKNFAVEVSVNYSLEADTEGGPCDSQNLIMCGKLLNGWYYIVAWKMIAPDLQSISERLVIGGDEGPYHLIHGEVLESSSGNYSLIEEYTGRVSSP